MIPSLIYFFVKDHKERIDIALFAALKNGGLATGFAVTLIGTPATVPMTIRAFIGLLFFIYFEWLVKKF